MKKFEWLFFMVFVLLFLGAQTQASVATWEYELSSTFESATLTNGNIIVTPATELTWGSNGTSRLVIDPNIVTGDIGTYIGGGNVPDNKWADSISITHDNHPINDPTLKNAVLSTTVILTAPNDTLEPFCFDFNIAFSETSNNYGDYRDNDIFALIDDFPNFKFSYDAGDGDGVVEYYLNVFPTSDGVLSTLNAFSANLANVPVGTIGFTTPENASTALAFSFTVSTEPLSTAPEPATMLLLGIGLLGIARVSRRNNV